MHKSYRYASESVRLACKYAYKNATPGSTLSGMQLLDVWFLKLMCIFFSVSTVASDKDSNLYMKMMNLYLICSNQPRRAVCMFSSISFFSMCRWVLQVTFASCGEETCSEWGSFSFHTQPDLRTSFFNCFRVITVNYAGKSYDVNIRPILITNDFKSLKKGSIC